MLTGLKEIIESARDGGYAVPAFNVYNMETIMGVMAAAEELSSPVIIQMYSRLFKEGSAYYAAPSIIKAANGSKIPVCFHLDHGASELEVTRALRYGCTGVMIDASAYDLQTNITITKKTVETAGYAGVTVEGELGHVGSAGDERMEEFTSVQEAKRFVDETGVAALAVLVGTAHGHYKKPPKLDIQRIADIASATDTPLVLHGGSGIPDDQITEAIKAGICKVNFGTDVCCSFLDEVFNTSRSIIGIDLFMRAPVESVRRFALEKIKLLGAAGRA